MQHGGDSLAAKSGGTGSFSTGAAAAEKYAVDLPRAPEVFATLVTAIAGFVDAVGYVQLSHLYVSFMSGNSTHLGVSMAARAWSDVGSAAAVRRTGKRSCCSRSKCSSRKNWHSRSVNTNRSHCCSRRAIQGRACSPPGMIFPTRRTKTGFQKAVRLRSASTTARGRKPG